MNPNVSAILRVLPFIIALTVFYIAYRKNKIKKDDIAWNPPKNRSSIFFWILCYAVFSVFTELFLYSQHLLQVEPWEMPTGAKILRSIGIVLLAPITEEIIFRGILLSKLRQKKINILFAVMLQAIAFVALHSFAYEGTLAAKIGIIQVFVDACLFGFARIHTHSLYTSIGMHMTGNLIAVMERIL